MAQRGKTVARYLLRSTLVACSSSPFPVRQVQLRTVLDKEQDMQLLPNSPFRDPVKAPPRLTTHELRVMEVHSPSVPPEHLILRT